MIKIVNIIKVMCVLLIIGCNRETSLQEYFVNHQGDADFIALDLPTSLMETKIEELSDENMEALKSIH